MGHESLYRAYRKAAEVSTVTPRDVGGLTHDHIFIAWSLAWCRVDVQGLVTSHPPVDERCNVPLMNSVHFSKAFSCPLASAMNPTKKCTFW